MGLGDIKREVNDERHRRREEGRGREKGLLLKIESSTLLGMPCSLLQLVFWIRDPSSHNNITLTKKRGWLRAYAPGLPKLTCNCRVHSSRLKENQNSCC